MVMLMAPGGTKHMALSALRAGADSVYVGPKGWSRRPAADELTDPEIKEVIEAATDTGKEVRIAVNVMPCPHEIPAFLEKVGKYVGWGAAGVMICDPGCISLVRQRFPDIDIHVSVTAGIFNIEDINFFQELGANLVIVPYRWGSAEIDEMRNGTDVGLEAFLFQNPHHGRICPGRCYASGYFNFKRWLDEEGKDHCIGTASRGGSCHRICRGKWELSINGSTYPHTPRLKRSPELILREVPDYIRMGVSCLKIPGRERSTGLICDIVRFYRGVIDHIHSGRDDLGEFESEWEALKRRWLVERVRRDETRISRIETKPPGHIKGKPPRRAKVVPLGHAEAPPLGRVSAG